MIGRREVVLGGLLTIVTAASDACCQPLNSPKRRYGCVIPGNQAPAFFASSSTHQLVEVGNETIERKSGHANFDYALAQTLSHITATFGVLPGFAYYDDGDGPNARATDAKRLERADGTVLFGQRLLRQTLVELDHPDVAVAAVCAHEYGHILQFKYGVHEKLNAGQVTVKRTELHADFLAGYYAGVKKLQKRDYPAAVFATKMRSMGDIQVDDPLHHGTPAERAGAIVAGFKAGHDDQLSCLEAIRTGMRYVSTL